MKMAFLYSLAALTAVAALPIESRLAALEQQVKIRELEHRVNALTSHDNVTGEKPCTVTKCGLTLALKVQSWSGQKCHQKGGKGVSPGIANLASDIFESRGCRKQDTRDQVTCQLIMEQPNVADFIESCVSS